MPGPARPPPGVFAVLPWCHSSIARRCAPHINGFICKRLLTQWGGTGAGDCWASCPTGGQRLAPSNDGANRGSALRSPAITSLSSSVFSLRQPFLQLTQAVFSRLARRAAFNHAPNQLFLVRDLSLQLSASAIQILRHTSQRHPSELVPRTQRSTYNPVPFDELASLCGRAPAVRAIGDIATLLQSLDHRSNVDRDRCAGADG